MLKRINDVHNATLIFAIIFMSLFGLLYSKIILIFVFLAILFNIKLAWPALKKHKLYLFLTLQYPIIHLLKINLLDNPDRIPLASVSTWQEPWLWLILIPLLTLPFFENVENLSKHIKVFIPLLIVIAFSWMLSRWLEAPAARQELFFRNVFGTPLFTSTLLIAYVLLAKRYTANLNIIILILSLMVAGICLEFAKVRGISLAFLAALGASFIYITFQSFKSLNGRIKNIFVFSIMILAVIGSIYLVMLFDDRLSLVLRELSHPNKVDFSTSIRLTMYKESLIEVFKAPIFGHGVAYEQIMVNKLLPGHIHTHNIYLSWLIWGGLLSLTSGMLFMFAAVLSLKNKGAAIKAFIFLLPISISQLFDSFLIWGDINQIFLIFSSMVYIALLKTENSGKHIIL